MILYLSSIYLKKEMSVLLFVVYVPALSDQLRFMPNIKKCWILLSLTNENTYEENNKVYKQRNTKQQAYGGGGDIKTQGQT